MYSLVQEMPSIRCRTPAITRYFHAGGSMVTSMDRKQLQTILSYRRDAYGRPHSYAVVHGRPAFRCATPGMARLFHATGRMLSAAEMGEHEPPSPYSYQDAINLLNTTQSGHKSVQEKLQKGALLDTTTVIKMNEWLRQLGYTPANLDSLNIVHVAGTKGKGTTCAYVNSILQCYQNSPGINLPRKIGLYTSPHLVAVRERIRINSEPLSEAKFAKYFFDVWFALDAAATAQRTTVLHDKSALDMAALAKPSYFRLLTLVAFHAFMREGVDVAIVEVGIGGEFDATNLVEHPAVVGISTLGIDHTTVLGDTLDGIAWHKAGIMKTGSRAFTVPQADRAAEVLQKRAEDKDVQLESVPLNPALAHVNVSPPADFQRQNASLAIQLAYTVLNNLGVQVDRARGQLPQLFVDGIENMSWRGRCEYIVTDQQHWYLDGAHNEDSLDIAAEWFAGILRTEEKSPVVLVFNQQSLRDAQHLLRVLHYMLTELRGVSVTHAIFCPSMTWKDSPTKPDFLNLQVEPKKLSNLSHQEQLRKIWGELDPDTKTSVVPSIGDAIACIRETYGGKTARVLVTGSLHLVGGALSILEGEDVGLASTSAKKPLRSEA